MELRLIDRAELAALYESDLARDFPPEELKPLAAMETLLARGRYDPLVMEDGGKRLGYAMVWTHREKGKALLDYLGVSPAARNGGVGAEILTHLARRYPHLCGEAEAPGGASPAEEELRRRRIGFYRRNGFRLLNYECALFGVHFNCLYRGAEEDDGAVCAWHRQIYADYFTPAGMEAFIQLPLGEGEAVRPVMEWIREEDHEYISL